MKRYGLLLFLLVMASVLLVACGSQEPEPVTFEIEMSEFAYSIDTLEAQVGQEVTIELLNTGLLEHELMIGRDVMMMNNRPSGYQHDMFEDAGVEPVVVMTAAEMHEDEHEEGDEHSEDEAEHEEGDEHSEDEAEHGHEGFMVALPAEAKEKATITFTVTEDMVGEWEIGCFLQEGVHYDAGMRGKFIVAN
jgi:plastocyanin